MGNSRGRNRGVLTLNAVVAGIIESSDDNVGSSWGWRRLFAVKQWDCRVSSARADAVPLQEFQTVILESWSFQLGGTTGSRY